MEFELQQVCKSDGPAVIDIFNHYVEHTFAAYPEAPVPYESFAMFQSMAEGYPFLVARTAVETFWASGSCALTAPCRPSPGRR